MAHTLEDQGWPDAKVGADEAREIERRRDHLCAVQNWLADELTTEALERFCRDFDEHDVKGERWRV